MNTQAELSLYPLKTSSLDTAISRFIDELAHADVVVTRGPMSTIVSGENEILFAAVSKSFEKASWSGEVVLVAKFSNACPAPTECERDTK
jgi:uncharacterized protein YqgV (UPF0045/DUF77 family)